jgi:1,4-dihydroxy-2-naphthoate octaprenyltransferase
MITATTYLASLFQLGRVLFLTGGFLLYGLGALVALASGAPLDATALFWGQVAVTAIQLMTHYSNEYYDLPADQVNPTPTRWAGGSQVLVAGRVSPAVALGIALLSCGVGLAAGLTLTFILHEGLLTLGLIVLAAVLAFGYSAPPLRLHSRGLGELTVALIVTVLTPLLGYSLQVERLPLRPLLAVVPLFLLQFAMMLILEIPDQAGDTAVGKRTLVVQLGPAGAVRLHNLLLCAAYLSLPVLIWAGLPPVAAGAVLLSAPVALWQGARLARGAWRAGDRWDNLSFWAIGLLVGTAAAEVLAFLWILQSQ